MKHNRYNIWCVYLWSVYIDFGIVLELLNNRFIHFRRRTKDEIHLMKNKISQFKKKSGSRKIRQVYNEPWVAKNFKVFSNVSEQN